MFIRRLYSSDLLFARELIVLMSVAFEETYLQLSDAQLIQRLENDAFWLIAAFDNEKKLIGGLSAHVLPMTRSPSEELFIYDLAVDANARRHGVASELIAFLKHEGQNAGINDIFVAAEGDDDGALAFYRSLLGEKGVSESRAQIFSFES